MQKKAKYVVIAYPIYDRIGAGKFVVYNNDERNSYLTKTGRKFAYNRYFFKTRREAIQKLRRFDPSTRAITRLKTEWTDSFS